MFDLTISPLVIESGQEQKDLPGLWVASAPRKAARLRQHDQLLMYMKLSGNSNLTPVQQQEILKKLSTTFYTTPGPLTTGLRAVIVRLNDFLWTRNMRSSKEGQVVAVMGLAVIHSNSLLVAHGGATHSFLVGKRQVQHFDAGQGVRGLGLGKQITPNFFQSSVEPGDVFLFSADPPSGWMAKSLEGLTQLGVESMRRRLCGLAGQELHGALIRFQSGKGEVNWHRASDRRPGMVKETPEPIGVNANPLPLSTEPSTSAVPLQTDASTDRVQHPTPGTLVENSKGKPGKEVPSVPQPSPTRQGLESVAIPSESEQVPTIVPTSSNPAQARVEKPSIARPGRFSIAGSQAVRGQSDSTVGARQASRGQERVKAPRTVGPNPLVQKAARWLSSLLGWAGRTRSAFGQTFRSTVRKLFPGRKEPFFQMSPAVMLSFAVLVPLTVAAVALAVYFNAGRSEQMAMNIYYAQQYAERAAGQTDLNAQREDWNQVILWVRRADQIKKSEQGKALKAQAQAALDSMDGVVRIDFRPVVPGGLGADVKVTRMVSTLTDAYLLDSNQGRIIRLVRTGTGFDMDPGFICGPGRAGSLIIGPLIDLATLPPNNEFRATVMGIDAGGNLVYCAPNKQSFDSRQLLQPDSNWGKISAITTHNNSLYLLDPLLNAVWFYSGNNGVYELRPRLFFDKQVPKMSDVVHFAVDQEFLYLLHGDGRMGLCEGSGFDFQPTRCNDPTPYGDSRDNRDPSPLRFEDTHFVQLQSTQPPDPSLFILDDSGPAIYHFSLRRLNFQRQYRQIADADFPFPDKLASAFVVTPNRRLLIAFDNQVFYGSLP